MEGAPVRVEFDFTVDDYSTWFEDAEAWDRLVAARAKDATRTFWFSLTVIAMLFATLASVFLTVPSRELHVASRAAGYLSMAFLALCGYLTIAYARVLRGVPAMRAQHLKLVKKGDFRTDFGPRSVELTPAAIVSQTNGGAVTRLWSSVWRIEESASAVYVQLFPGWCISVPRRAFSSDAERTEFVALARRYHEGASQTELKRVRAFIADQDVKCRTCGYNLRGSDGAACPECGLRLDYQLVSGRLERAE